MNSFYLKRVVLGRHPKIELAEGEYHAIVSAKQGILDALSAEELLDALMGNYEELERELLALALREASYMSAVERWTDSIDLVQLLSRRVGNLLSTAHGYCDQVPHLVSSMYGRDSDELRSVRIAFRHEYDSVLGYRVCVELRRFAQHRGRAVHGYSAPGQWQDRSGGRRVRVHTLAPLISARELREDNKFKSAVLDALESTVKPIECSDPLVFDLRPFIREYVSALGRIHLRLRELLAGEIARHDATILGAIGRYSALPDFDGLLGLAVMELNERELLEDRRPTYVMREPIDRRVQLARKNHLPVHFDTQVVSNELELS